MSSSIFALNGAIDGNTDLPQVPLRILLRIDFNLRSVCKLRDVLDHAATCSNYLRDVVGRNNHIERVPTKVIPLLPVVFLNPLAKLLYSHLHSLQAPFHRAYALVRLQDSVIVILVASHINFKPVFEVFRKVAVFSNDESASISVNYELGRQFDILL